MTQTLTTSLRCALIEGASSGNAVHYAHDFSDLLGDVRNTHGFCQSLGTNLQATGSTTSTLTLTPGQAFLRYTKTSGETGFLKFSLLASHTFDLTAETDGTYYLFVELVQEIIDAGSAKLDASDAAMLKIATSYPSGSHLPLAKLVKSGTTLAVTDLREAKQLALGSLRVNDHLVPDSKLEEFSLHTVANSLSVTIRGGVYKETGAEATDTTLALTASATNYAQLDILTGAITANTTGFTQIALYEITTSASAVLNIADKRNLYISTTGSLTKASQAEAEAGANDSAYMTPLKTKQSIEAHQNLTDTQATTLTGGDSSNADALHTHPKLTGIFVTNFSRNMTIPSNTQTIAHGLAKAPSLVRLTGCQTGESYINTGFSFGTYDGTSTRALTWGASGPVSSYDTTSIFKYYYQGTCAAVCTIDATNITLTWTSNCTSNVTIYFIVEAYS